MSEYKKIVLLKGLEKMEDYQFRIIKSLLKRELQLSEKMQNNYDRIQIADKMEETFPKDAGLNKLIEICQESTGLKYLVEDLKKEKAKVKKPNKGKVKTAVKKRKQEEPSSSQSLSTDNEQNKNKCSSKKQKRENIKNETTVKTEISQEGQQLRELSATSSSSAASEHQNSQRLLITDPSSLQTPQTPPVTCLTLKVSQGSPAPPCQNFPVPTVSDTSIHLNSHCSPTLSSAVQTPYVPSATASDPQASIPILTSRAQATQMHPGAASSFIQNPHAPPLRTSRSECTTQVLQGEASSTGQALPCPEVKPSRHVLPPRMPSEASERLLASCASPPTASKSLPAPRESPANTSSGSCMTPRRGNIPKEPTKEEGHHQDPKEVMVLKVTEPFTYDLIDDKRMFHATVATENEFFRVKIFDPVLKNKFIPNKIIAISNYFGLNGFLEIYQASCVSDVDKNKTMGISKTLRQRANGTPKIRDLFSKAKGTFVNGEFVVYKKTERNSFIYYGIEDDTGKMEVVVYGRLTSIKCEPGQKLRLICFELSSREDTWQLKSVRHSFMQVINVRKKVTQA
ncbi:Interferon-activable protein 204 [Lemmus lemmus]